jgi:hypothetical protein
MHGEFLPIDDARLLRPRSKREQEACSEQQPATCNAREPCARAQPPTDLGFNPRPHSHSMVAGGLLLIS